MLTPPSTRAGAIEPVRRHDDTQNSAFARQRSEFNSLGQPQPQQGPVGVRPTPLPKRAKGRWFVGVMLSAMIGFAVYSGWDSLLRYPVRGEIAGRVIHVPAPWPGVMRTLHVQEGEEVAQGQLLLTVASLDLEHRLAEVQDQLQVGQAELAAQVAELKWESELRGDRRQQAAGDYYQLYGQLLMERSKLEQAESHRRRLESMQAENADSVSERQIESARFAQNGLRAEVAKLEKAVAKLRERADNYAGEPLDAGPRIKPQLLRIEKLQSELTRIRQKLKQGEVRAPVSGRVVEIDHFTGEHVEPTDSVVKVVEAGTLEAVLYAPQTRSQQLENASFVDIRVAGETETTRCDVIKTGQRLSPAPSHLQRYYRSEELLTQILIRPRNHPLEKQEWKLGSEVRLVHWGRVSRVANARE